MERIVVLEVAERLLAVPLAAVERVARMVAVTPLPGAPAVISGLIDDGGRVVAVADPGVRLGRPAARPRLDERLVFVRTPRRALALRVDEVQGTREIDEGDLVPLDGPGRSAGASSGAVATPEGIILVQDLERFLDAGEERDLDEALRRRGNGS